MKRYKPSSPFNFPMELFVPQYVSVKGSSKKIYPDKGKRFYCSFRTFGGTEKIVNNVLTAENTAVIETYYRNDITAECLIKTLTGEAYEVIGVPENIQMLNAYMKFKIRAVKGGA